MRLEEIYDRLNMHEPGYIGRHLEFSVLIPLVEREDGITLVYQQRGSKIARQPGEISFPGGAKEKGETDLECAVRETCEELEIDASMIQDVTEVATMNTWGGYTIHAFTGKMDAEAVDSFTPNIEVAEIFEVPLEWLLDNEPEIHMAAAHPGFEDGYDEANLGYPDGYRWGVLRSEEPIYDFEGRMIWGITARITKYFINVLKG